jgi:uncharacterized protein YutE (UPF0331/DUF86 family)
VLDREGILARLDALDEYVEILREQQGVARAEFIGDYHLYGLAERYLQLSIECVLDIGRMLIVGLKLRKPERHEDIIDILEEAGIISTELAARMQGMAGFRNVLVHMYLRIDRDLVYQNLREEIEDFEDFADQVVMFMRSIETEQEEESSGVC